MVIRVFGYYSDGDITIQKGDIVEVSLEVLERMKKMKVPFIVVEGEVSNKVIKKYK